MIYLYLAALIAGLLLGVRLMFFGAERRRRQAAGALPLRRSEPAMVAFLAMVGLAGYLLTRHSQLGSARTALVAVALGVAWAFVVTRAAIATARLVPAHDPDDPRFLLQGCVAVVTSAIPASGEGAIAYEDGSGSRSVSARTIDEQAVSAGQEVCIERIEDGVAFVELWTNVESRL